MFLNNHFFNYREQILVAGGYIWINLLKQNPISLVLLRKPVDDTSVFSFRTALSNS